MSLDFGLYNCTCSNNPLTAGVIYWAYQWFNRLLLWTLNYHCQYTSCVFCLHKAVSRLDIDHRSLYFNLSQEQRQKAKAVRCFMKKYKSLETKLADSQKNELQLLKMKSDKLECYNSLKKSIKTIQEQLNHCKSQNRDLGNEIEILQEQLYTSATQKNFECAICLEGHMKLVFECGHWACATCSANLNKCHMCRQYICNKIQIYY